MKKFFAVAAVAALALAGCATRAAEGPPVVYTVVKEDADIPFASQGVRNFRVGKDEPRSILLEGPNGRWYRLQLDPHCRSLLPWEQAIGIVNDVTNSVSKFTTLIIDGQRCRVRAIDQIVDPDDKAEPAVAPAT